MFKLLKKVKKNRKGYTLTELIVVVAILGVLAAIATPVVLNQVQTARVNADSASENAIETAVQLCIAEGSLVMNGNSKIADADSSTAPNLSGLIAKKLVGGTYPVPQVNKSDDIWLNLLTGEVIISATNPGSKSGDDYGTDDFEQLKANS